MGRYQLSKKDAKLNDRFRQSLNTQSKFMKPVAKKVVKKVAPKKPKS